MKSRLFQGCVMLMIGAVSVGSYAADPGPSTQQLMKELGIDAVLTTNVYLAAQKRIQEGKPDEAMKLINAEYSRLVPDLRRYDAEIATEPKVRELRDRIVKTLQTRWLKDPPTYLDEESAKYLERTCATIPQCPKGRVHPLKQVTLPPEK